MSLATNYTTNRRVVIAGNGWVEKFRFFLPYLTMDVEQAYHEIMYAVVESVRYRDKAITTIVQMVRNLEANIEYGVSVKSEIVQTIKRLAMEIYYQVEEYNLYNNDGILMYYYEPHPEPTFPDIVLKGIIQLTYTGAYFEPL